MQRRHTAYRFWIKDIVSGEQRFTSDSRFFFIHNKEVLRVNIVASVINRYENPEKRYVALTLDDGSGQIRLKAWDEDVSVIGDVSIGDIINVVGTLYESNGEIFVRPEIVKKTSSEWAIVRKIELTKLYGKPAEEVVTITEEHIEEPVIPSVHARETILALIEQASEEGIEIEELIKSSKLKEREAEAAITELLAEGEIFKPRQGYLKRV